MPEFRAVSNDQRSEKAALRISTALVELRENAVLFALLGAALYGIGFLIVNSYLASLGVIELELIRPRYLAVGTLFLVLISSPVVVFELFTKRELGDRWYTGAVGAIWALVLLAVVDVVVANGLSGVMSTSPIFVAVISLAGNGALLLCWVLVRIAMRMVSPGLAVITVPLIFFFLLVVYAQTIYPLLFRWLGGGLAEPVQVVLSAEAKAACEPCNDLKYLVDEDGQRLILLADVKGRARVIARQHVIAVIYRERR